MILTATPILGAYVIEPEPVADERGFFARLWCEETFRRAGLDTQVTQCSVSSNHRAGTLRGLHYQGSPDEETKWVRCQAGAVFDVIVDLRKSSPSFLCWFGAELTARNHKAVYVPAGVAHGFISLENESVLYYQIGGRFVPGSARGVRWDDPLFAIKWPLTPLVISERDLHYPDFNP